MQNGWGVGVYLKTKLCRQKRLKKTITVLSMTLVIGMHVVFVFWLKF